MPAVTSGKVLLTGANGYLAIWMVNGLLKQGYAVRASVRSAGKGVYLKTKFAEYGEKLEIAVVPDIAVEGAFDEAVQGVDAIIHAASPIDSRMVKPEDFSVPAVKGSTGILRSAIAHGSSVKRIVVASAGTLVTFAPKVYDETDWSEVFEQECEQKGSDASVLFKYIASKVLAEKAVWEVYEKNKASVPWDIVTILPSLVFGPLLQDITNVDGLEGSMKEWYTSVFGEGKTKTQLPDGFEWIDVRDVADAHVKAISAPEAAGERILVSSGPYKWEDWVIVAREFTDKATAVDSSYDPATAVHGIQFNNEKMKRILGITQRSKAETAADIVRDFKEKGWLN